MREAVMLGAESATWPGYPSGIDSCEAWAAAAMGPDPPLTPGGAPILPLPADGCFPVFAAAAGAAPAPMGVAPPMGGGDFLSRVGSNLTALVTGTASTIGSAVGATGRGVATSLLPELPPWVVFVGLGAVAFLVLAPARRRNPGHYRHEDVGSARGFTRIRTITTGRHRIRVGYRGGRSRVISVLHPRSER